MHGLFLASLWCISGVSRKAAADAATTSGMLLGSKVETWHTLARLQMACNALRLRNCEFGAEACGAAGLEMLLQRYRRFDLRCTIWDGTAQHCFFKLSRAFVGQEESYEQVQVCASALSFFADVCHGHVVMAPKSSIQQSKNLRTIQIQEFYERLHSEVSSSELRNAGPGL